MSILKKSFWLLLILSSSISVAQYRPAFLPESREYFINDDMFDPLFQKQTWDAFNLKGRVKSYTDRFTYYTRWNRPVQKSINLPIEFEFNESGNLTKKITYTGETKLTYIFFYDCLNRKTQIQHLINDTIAFKCFYTYNAFEKLDSFTAYGTDASHNFILLSQTTGSFDADGNLIEEVVISNNHGFKLFTKKTVLAHSYNSKGLRIHTERFTYSLQEDSVYVPISEGRMTTYYKYNQENVEIVDEFTLDKTSDYKNYLYDKFGKLLEKSIQNRNNGNYSLQELNEYNQSQNLTKKTINTFDWQGQIFGKEEESFLYDSNGNQISRTYEFDTEAINKHKKILNWEKVYIYDDHKNWLRVDTKDYSEEVNTTYVRTYKYY